jgi:hypothetical protein
MNTVSEHNSNVTTIKTDIDLSTFDEQEWIYLRYILWCHNRTSEEYNDN